MIQNFGKDTAVKVGLNHLKDKEFDNLIIMDGDLQHPINSIKDFINESNNEHIVQGLRCGELFIMISNTPRCSTPVPPILVKNAPDGSEP